MSEPVYSDTPTQHPHLSRSRKGVLWCLCTLVCFKLLVDIILEILIIERHVQLKTQDEMMWVH